MERLSGERRTVYKKLGTERLSRALIKYCWKAALIKDFSCQALLKELAKEWLMEEEATEAGAAAAGGPEGEPVEKSPAA